MANTIKDGYSGLALQLTESMRDNAGVVEQDGDGFFTETNANNIHYFVGRIEGVDDVPTDALLREADRDIRALERQGVKLKADD